SVALAKQLRGLATTAIRSSLATIIGSFKLIVPGLRTYIDNSAYAHVVTIEGLQGQAALDRSKTLISRSRYLAMVFQVYDHIFAWIMFIMPLIIVAFANGVDIPRMAISGNLIGYFWISLILLVMLVISYFHS